MKLPVSTSTARPHPSSADNIQGAIVAASSQPTSFMDLPREIRDLVYDHAFDGELIVWILSREINTAGSRFAYTLLELPRTVILKNPRKQKIMNLGNKQLREELSDRMSRMTVYARLHKFALGRDVRLLSRRNIPSPNKIQLEIRLPQDFDSSLDSYYRRNLWQSNTEFVRELPNLQSLQVDVLEAGQSPSRCGILVQLLQELAHGHPYLHALSECQDGQKWCYELTGK
jgi:hypothetical protein